MGRIVNTKTKVEDVLDDEIQPVPSAHWADLSEIQPVRSKAQVHSGARMSFSRLVKDEDVLVDGVIKLVETQINDEIQSVCNGDPQDDLNEIQPVRPTVTNHTRKLARSHAKNDDVLVDEITNQITGSENPVQEVHSIHDRRFPRHWRDSMTEAFFQSSDNATLRRSLASSTMQQRQAAEEADGDEIRTVQMGKNARSTQRSNHGSVTPEPVNYSPVGESQSCRRRAEPTLEVDEACTIKRRRIDVEASENSVVVVSDNSDAESPAAESATGMTDDDDADNDDEDEDYINDAPSSDVGTSVKISAFLTQFEKILKDTDDKVLCFSQWTRMLDMLEEHLDPIVYVRLDGSQSLDVRSQKLMQFNSNRKCRLFLISLKAGSTGLNLTVANRVFLLDSWWNPAVEDQAIDRVHRLGQTKPVEIIKFKVKNTVEKSIYKLQDKKRAIADGALGKEGLKVVGRQRLSMDEILGLFGNVFDNVAQNTQTETGAQDEGFVGMVETLRTLMSGSN